MILSLLLPMVMVFQSFNASAETSEELSLNFNYTITCDVQNNEAFPGVVAEVKIGTRTLRVPLLRYKNTEEVSLGKPSAAELNVMSIKFLKNSACEIKNENHAVKSLIPTDSSKMSRLALEHSPYLVQRPDQVNIATRDIPLHLAYSVISKADQGFSIRYTITFSNESDYGKFSTSKVKSMALYGRRTDIEWMYQVDFDANQNVTLRTFQSGVKFGIGHATWIFNGQYLKNTLHPILFNIAKHNVFSAIPFPGQKLSTAANHLIPREEMKYPEAREDWMWRSPWSFDLSDRELRRTGHLTYSSDQYLFVKISGAMNGGKIEITGNGLHVGKITLSKLGEDSWSKESYIAVRLKRWPNELQVTGDSIKIKPTTSKVKIDRIQFFKLQSNGEKEFVPSEVTSLFECSSNDCHY